MEVYLHLSFERGMKAFAYILGGLNFYETLLLADFVRGMKAFAYIPRI